ncbi:family 10 glycosylhydrolase [Paenibacillus beijingensis]|uniref:Glycosyl hydrolase-like 10 domain-containing protein n=1 Tax=Paenibacillus beijingensis TaxID=1126833 RepID=A0A0D5NF10_9BACL|nr:family 10 glycosylhydrolase [Paenibacillus beijingensis]AJY73567.1 hypothetical protein VN24_01640 [Paenibacillus beijingensis]
MKFRLLRLLLSWLLLLTVTLSAAGQAARAAEPRITLYLDGQKIESDVSPYILAKVNVTMVPMRVISEGLGASIVWNSADRTVTVRSPDTTIVMTLNRNTATVNGKKVNLDASVQFKLNRTMVPLRFVSEQLGLKVEWDQTTKSVKLMTSGATEPGDDPSSGPAQPGNEPGSPGGGSGFYDSYTTVRGAWISTVFNLDWPSNASKGIVSKQKEEFAGLLDKLQALGINTVFVQVRPAGDALYPSAAVPWSKVLTGMQGQNPGYDPLAFMVEEAHKRGMKFQAWFNPFRANTDASVNGLAPNHVSLLHPDWIVNAGGKSYINPGIAEARQHIIDTILEVVNGYNIDGIHLDDYFYPANTAFNDDAAYLAYAANNTIGLMNRDDWRRSNINAFVQQLDVSIHAVKPRLDFGISPFGVWRNKAADATGSDTRASVTAYDSMYADVRTWIQNGWIDYVVPQVYWSFALDAAPYDKVTEWWVNEVKGTGVRLYIGHAPYKLGTTKEVGWSTSDEIINQLKYNRNHIEISGDIYFSAKDLLKNPLNIVGRLTAFYQTGD